MGELSIPMSLARNWVSFGGSKNFLIQLRQYDYLSEMPLSFLYVRRHRVYFSIKCTDRINDKPQDGSTLNVRKTVSEKSTTTGIEA